MYKRGLKCFSVCIFLREKDETRERALGGQSRVDLQSMRLVRRGANDAIEIEEIEDDFDVPDDAVVALDLLRDQFPPTAGPLPVAWVSQIYSLVKEVFKNLTYLSCLS